MEHSVSAYLARLPKAKVEQLWKEWTSSEELAPDIDPAWVEILKLRLTDLISYKNPPETISFRGIIQISLGS